MTDKPTIPPRHLEGDFGQLFEDLNETPSHVMLWIAFAICVFIAGLGVWVAT